MTTQWINPTDNTSIFLTKQDGTKLTLKVGDCITFRAFSDISSRLDGVIITSFTSKDFKSNPNTGPIGMTYLPWRKDEKRWATASYGMRGDSRHVICYPTGTPHYGEHIEWDTVEIIPNPEKF